LFWYFSFAVFLWKIVQQFDFDFRVQEQQRVHHQQEKPNGLQGLSSSEMLAGRNVKERITIRPTIELVQDPLLASRAAASSGGQQSPKTVSTIAKLTEPHEASFILVQLILASSVHERRINDAEARRLCKTLDRSIVALDKLARQPQFGQFI
jgi:hypothetical protein